RIVTGPGSFVTLEIEGLPPIVIGPDRQFVLSADVMTADIEAMDAWVADADSPEAEYLAQLLESGTDPFTVLEPPAALSDAGGPGPNADLGTGGGRSISGMGSVVRLLSIMQGTAFA